MEDVAPAADVLEEDPERAALLGAQQVEVRDANMRLAPRQRMVLALRELEDRSYAEIGEILGMNENAVAQLISRARIRLREELRMGQIDRSALSPETQRLLPTARRLLRRAAEGREARGGRGGAGRVGRVPRRGGRLRPGVEALPRAGARGAARVPRRGGRARGGGRGPGRTATARRATRRRGSATTRRRRTQAPGAAPQPEPEPSWTQDDVPTMRDLPAVGAAGAGGGGGAAEGRGRWRSPAPAAPRHPGGRGGRRGPAGRRRRRGWPPAATTRSRARRPR